jgi:hypothetical protein
VTRLKFSVGDNVVQVRTAPPCIFPHATLGVGRGCATGHLCNGAHDVGLNCFGGTAALAAARHVIVLALVRVFLPRASLRTRTSV